MSLYSVKCPHCKITFDLKTSDYSDVILSHVYDPKIELRNTQKAIDGAVRFVIDSASRFKNHLNNIKSSHGDIELENGVLKIKFKCPKCKTQLSMNKP